MKLSNMAHSEFLTDCATRLARAYTERDTLKGIYLGQNDPTGQYAVFTPQYEVDEDERRPSNDPTGQYAVFTPLLWECTAFLCYCLKIRKFEDERPTPAEINGIINRLVEEITIEGKDRDKLFDRINQYVQGEDVMEMFGIFCNYASETEENAVALLQAKQEKNRYGNYATTIQEIGSEIFRKAYLGE